MQINWGYHKDKGWLQGLGINKREDLFDPVKNMKAINIYMMAVAADSKIGLFTTKVFTKTTCD